MARQNVNDLLAFLVVARDDENKPAAFVVPREAHGVSVAAGLVALTIAPCRPSATSCRRSSGTVRVSIGCRPAGFSVRRDTSMSP